MSNIDSRIDIPMRWRRSAERIASAGSGKILVIGATDTGKSTYCRFLSQYLLETGSTVAMVDADIGQKDIGPPAAITLGYPERSPELAETDPVSFYFVGSTSPARHLLPMVVGTKQLTESARASFVIINTTGLIHAIGSILKGFKIEAVNPDIIVAIERSNELASLLRSYRNFETIRISPSSKVILKTPDIRKAAREDAFRNYFQKGSIISFDVRKIILQRTLLFSGSTISAPDSAHCERTSEGILTVSDTESDQLKGARVLPLGFERYLLCDIADRRNIGLGLGIIKEIDFRAGTISLVTPVCPEKIKVIQPGDIYITPKGVRLDVKRPAGL